MDEEKGLITSDAVWSTKVSKTAFVLCTFTMVEKSLLWQGKKVKYDSLHADLLNILLCGFFFFWSLVLCVTFKMYEIGVVM